MDKILDITIDKCKKIIQSIEEVDSNNEYAYERMFLSYLKLNHLPIVMYEIPEGTPLFRARTHKENILYKKITDIGIPPEDKVRNFARCNRPFQPLFYCSESRPVSFMELVEYWSDTTDFGEKLFVTVGKWILKTSLNLIIVADPDEKTQVTEFDKYHGNGINEFLNRYSGEVKESYRILFEFLAEKFRAPAKNDLKTYLITSAYSNIALMHANGKAVGMHYPSVPFGGEGLNFAINKEFYSTNKLELIYVIRNEFISKKNEYGKHTFTETDRIECKKIDIANNMLIW